ncbi:MAG TPA: glycosyltransferase N-terminal domain-containing protein [Bacteroidales bacterium]|nr:glycosyltransferase N-terminal domain-containing protein [Bacteroidales bacterium]HPS70905.1 glycosyltransferase N-terminal domain-containing protein [Bacteroidales bacterium]
MRLFYTFAIYIYQSAIHIASLFNHKAKLWIQGRKNIFNELEFKCAGNQYIVWFHCASLGEFEQGKPFIEKVKNEHPQTKILVTFFSPSGYTIRKNDPIADFVFYLPIDTISNAKKFIKIVNPRFAVFVKYEYWYNYIQQLDQKNIPFFYISAIFRKEQYLFKWYGSWFVRQLKKCTRFFVQDDQSISLMQQLKIENVTKTGDTRFDRVYKIASQSYDLPYVVQFKNRSKLLVAGSTWEPDDKILKSFLDQNKRTFKLIIAPHEIHASRIQYLKDLFFDYSIICFSEMEQEHMADYQVFIIDTIGILSKIYKYSDYSYIGGAFGAGLHNILEAAVFGVPLFFGPKYQKFKEARDLVQLEGAFSILNDEQLILKITQLEMRQEEYDKTCNICKKFVHNNIGAVDMIYSVVKDHINW